MTALRSPGPSVSELRFMSSSITHVGSMRRLNRDSVLERSETGLWAIADGMGGDNTPGIGSALVARALSRIEPFDSQYSGRRATRAALGDVNAALFQRARDERLGNIGASVIVLLIQEGQYACLWAGNCRAYLYRDGALRQVSSDHCIEEPRADRSASSYRPILTRAVGSATRLEIDAVGGDIKAGDRFLLCSDGVAVLEESQLEQIVSHEKAGKALADLIEKALEIGASDNLSAVVVECH